MSKAVDVVMKWRVLVSDAAQIFEARWTGRRLAEVDKTLAEKLHKQCELFRAACERGTRADVARHGAGLVKGYAAAVAALEDAGALDDAYQLGVDPKSGTVVAIGQFKASADYVATMRPGTIWVTPDEIAALFARVAALKTIATAKRQWPGAEISPDWVHVGEQPINQFDQPIPADDALEDDL